MSGFTHWRPDQHMVRAVVAVKIQMDQMRMMMRYRQRFAIGIATIQNRQMANQACRVCIQDAIQKLRLWTRSRN